MPINTVKEARLGDVVKYIRGVTFAPEDKLPLEDPRSVVCMRTKNIQEELDVYDLLAVPSSCVKRREQFLQTKDILVSSANSWNLVGKCVQVPKLGYAATAGGFISIVRPTTEIVDADYLYRWLAYDGTQHLVRRCARQTTNIANLDVGQFLDIRLPLPPLPEQQRIAGILSRADRLRRLRRYALEMSEGYLQAVFLEMFGDPATNPMGWKQARIGDVVAISQYGTSAKSNSDKRGYPVLGMGNITYTGEIDLTNVAWVYLTVEEFAALRLEPGDIVFNRTNSTELVGKTAQWAYSLDAVLASYLVKLRLSNQVLPSYFVALLNTRYFKLMFQARCLKAVGQSNISPTLLKEFPMLIPPLSMQRSYQEVVDKHKRLRGQQREALRQAEHLFQTLLHGAFRGEG